MLIRTGAAVNAEAERAMLASFGVPQTVLNSLAVSRARVSARRSIPHG